MSFFTTRRETVYLLDGIFAVNAEDLWNLKTSGKIL